MEIKVASLCCGCGGLDLGFHQAGFDVVWANDYDARVHPTYAANFPDVTLDGRSIRDVSASDIPDVDGVIGSVPCQSWSEAGARRGISDPRGQLFFDYIRIIKDKQPKFFVSENVSGLLHHRNLEAFAYITGLFTEIGYTLSFKLLDCSLYGVPQTRERVFIVGIRNDLNVSAFEFPEPSDHVPTMRDAIFGMGDPIMVKRRVSESESETLIPNHDCTTGDFSRILCLVNVFESGIRLHSQFKPLAAIYRFIHRQVQ